MWNIQYSAQGNGENIVKYALSQKSFKFPHQNRAYHGGSKSNGLLVFVLFLFQISGLGIHSFDLSLFALLVALIFKKRVTVRESLLISLKESDVSDLLVIRAYCSQKRAIRSKKRIFLMFLSDFHSFPYSYDKRANRSHCFSLSCSIIKNDGNYSLSSLVTKEQLWARIAPVNLVQKNDCERIDPGYL